MITILHILRYKLQAALKVDRPIRLGAILSGLGVSLVYLSFAVAIFLFVKAILHYTLTQTKIGLFLLHEFISMILFVFFVTVNIGNIIVAYATLYKSEEVTFLMARPVAPAQIFLIKFLDNFFYSSANFIVILLAGILAYATYFKLGFLTITAILIFDFMPFIFSAGMIGVLLLLMILHLAIRIGLKPVLFCLALIYITGVVGYFRVMSPIRLVNAVLEHYPNVNQYFVELLPPVVRILPNHWLSDSLFWLSQANWSASVRYIGYQLVFCLSSLGLTLFLGYRFYYQTWLMLPSLKISFKRKKFSQSTWFAQSTRFSAPTAAIFKRDLLIFMREPSQIIHFTVMLILILIFIGSLTHINLGVARNVQLQTLIYLTINSFNAFLIASLTLRFIYPLISLEGQACWKLRSAPLTARRLMNCKLLPFYLLVLLLGGLLSYFSNYRFAPILIVVSTAVAVCTGTALTALNFGMGGAHANFTEKSPIRIASSQGATLSFLLSLIYIVSIFGMLFFPIRTYFEKGAGLSIFQNALLSIALISGIVTLCFYRLGLRSFYRDL